MRTFLGTLWRDTGLDPQQRELVILAVAREIDSTYEWHQHVAIARDVGVSDGDTLAIADGDLDRFDRGDWTLIDYALAVVRGEVDDDCHDALAASHGPTTVVGVAALAGGYLLVGRLLAVETDDGVPPGIVWLPIHHPAVNRLTLPIVDPESDEPSYKQCAVDLDAPTGSDPSRPRAYRSIRVSVFVTNNILQNTPPERSAVDFFGSSLVIFHFPTTTVEY